jgi:hypothetical protein
MAKQAIGSEKYAKYNTETLVEAFEKGPQRIKEAIKGLTNNELHGSPIPGKWTIAEILIHLADAEIIGSCRIRQAFTEHPGDFPGYNESKWAKVLNYQSQSLEIVFLNIELFRLLRKTTSLIFRNCTDADWLKEGTHPERGKMNLRAVLELYADHSERHLQQILERRALLGKPLQMELMIKERLY